MAAIEVQIDIHAPRARVFEVFSDLASCAQRINGIQSLELLSDGPMQEGTRWRETRKMFGQDASEDMWVTAFDPPNSYTVEAESHGSHYTSTYWFEEAAQLTRVRLRFASTPISLGAKLMSLFSAAFMGPVKKMLLADMQDLKRYCEEA